MTKQRNFDLYAKPETIVERLRVASINLKTPWQANDYSLCDEAADLIERLRSAPEPDEVEKWKALYKAQQRMVRELAGTDENVWDVIKIKCQRADGLAVEPAAKHEDWCDQNCDCGAALDARAPQNRT